MSVHTTPRVLIVGGYGLVGGLIARRLRDRHPDMLLVIAGRDLDKARSMAEGFTPAEGVRVDVADADPLASLDFTPDLVVGVVNDVRDQLMLACVGRGIAFVDITRWSERMRTAVMRLSGETPTAPVLLASGWMAGAVATMTSRAARSFARLDTVTIDILFSMSDAAGPDSLAAADRLSAPIPILVAGGERLVKAFSDPRRVTFANVYSTRTWRYDTPDQTTGVVLLGAGEVSSRINYDNPWPMRILRPLLACGIWKLLEHPALNDFRRSLLYSPGKGGRHEVRIELAGTGPDGAPLRQVATLIDPAGQAHMTASGAVDQIERCLGLNGRTPPRPGLGFPEQALDLDRGLAALTAMGVEIRLETVGP
jgi:NAD(P)-dependent dehydrogenase (short-subunit alcohol dehydrogenase family)